MANNERIRQPGAPKRITVPEEVTFGATHALERSYTSGQSAIMDLIDNAVDNRIEGKPITVNVRIDERNNTISIQNYGGYGLSLEGIKEFYRWGQSSKVGQIGQYGVGGKSAMRYLGRTATIECSSFDSQEAYRFKLEDIPAESSGRNQIDREINIVAKRPDRREEGYFFITVADLRNKSIRRDALVARLSDTYKYLLEQKHAVIRVNGVEVKPLEIKYLEDDPNFKPQYGFLKTGFGKELRTIVGVLEEGQNAKPGIRCYYRGRLIADGQFFGHPDPAHLRQASKLIGEIHLDNVPVTAQKDDFDRDSAEWRDASETIHRYLSPLFEKLKTMKIEQKTQIEENEREIARDVKVVFDHILSEASFIKKDTFPVETGREQTRSEDREADVTTGGRKVERDKKEKPPGDYEGYKEGRQKRLGAYEIRPQPMGSNAGPYAFVEQDNNRILQVNTDFPEYQTAKMAGHPTLHMYVADTYSLAVCQDLHGDQSVSVFLEELNRFKKHYGEYYGEHLSHYRPGRSKKSK